MRSDTVLEIEVVNWDRYNPRADRGGFSWFRMDNQFYMHMRQRKGYSADATILMAFLLAESSANNGRAFKLRIGFAAEMLGKTSTKVACAIEDLLKHDDIRFKPLEAASSLTDGRTDETDRTDVTDQAAAPLTFNFEVLYQKYPLKKGRTEGFARCKAQIKTQADFDQLSIAIDRYRRDLAAKGTDAKFIKHFSSFMGANDKQPWRDWLDPAAGKATLGAPAPVSKIAAEPLSVPEERTDPARVKEILNQAFKPSMEAM